MRTDWRRLAAAPLVRMLALSLSLHLALIMLIQPAPGSAVPRTLVIQARLADRPRPQAEAEPRPDIPEEAVVAGAPPAPVQEPEPPRTLPERHPAPPLASVPAEPSSPLPPALPGPTTVPSQPAPVAEVPSPVPPPTLPSPVAMPTEAPHAASRSAEGGSTSLPQVPVPFDTRWYAAREVDALPKPKEGIRYAYPESARKAGIEGSVLVLLRVDEQGRVRDVEVLDSVPPGVFDELVLDTLRRVAFAPARLNGAPVRALVKHRVRFELE